MQSRAWQHQRQALACAVSFTLAFLLKQHSGLDLSWWSAIQWGKNWPPAQTTTMQIESLSHSFLAWLCTGKTTHSGGLAMCSCQNRDSVDEQSLLTSPVMSCGWIRCGALCWLPNTSPGMNSCLIVFGWRGCAFYSTVRKVSLGYMYFFFFSRSIGLQYFFLGLAGVSLYLWFFLLFLDKQALWKARVPLHHFHTVCRRAPVIILYYISSYIKAVRCICGISESGICILLFNHLLMSRQFFIKFIFLCCIRKNNFIVV